MPAILDGVRVLDLTIAMSGPLATMRLGDLGADVIKVEPLQGEWQRHTAAGGGTGNRINVSFLALNRNKRSVAIDLKHPKSRPVVERLVGSADVVVQNYRPGVAARLGLGYERVRELRPDVVYVSISGYGESGPYHQFPGQDLLLQGLSGAMMSAVDSEGYPRAAPTYLVDAVTGYNAFEAVLAGLLHRHRTGEGQLITVNMLDAIIAMQMQEISVYTVGQVPQTPVPSGHANCYIRAPYAPFPTKDGYLILAFPPLAKLAELLDIPWLAGADDETDGHSRKAEIHDAVAATLTERTTAEWLQLFRAHDVWAGPVYGYRDLVRDPQVIHNGSLVSYDHPTEGRVTTPGFPIGFARTPATVRAGAPLAGQHTLAVLREVGLSEAQAQALLDANVVAAPAPEQD
jgi:crotonobetainyl-CoA:carnitine CoA-transferase CaiB-like acyl-CoA transferase